MTSLNLAANELTGRVPSEIGALTKMSSNMVTVLAAFFREGFFFRSAPSEALRELAKASRAFFCEA